MKFLDASSHAPRGLRWSSITVLAALSFVIARSTIAQSPTRRPPPNHGSFPNVSPDGRQVLFSRDSADRSFPYIMNADGSHQRVLSDQYMPLSWFPDSKRLLAGVRGAARGAPIRLFTVNVDGTDLKTIPTGDVSIIGGASLLADGKTLMFATPGRDSAGRPTMSLGFMNMDGSSIRRIEMPSTSGRLVGPPVPSPDGRRLAFVVVDNSDPTSYARSTTLSVMNIDGTNPREVATLPNLLEHIAWSRDGRLIAVSQTGRTPPVGTPMPPDYVHDANLVVIEAETGVIRPIFHHDQRYVDELPSWAPNGDVYFASDRDGPMEIYRMKADGSAQTRITGPTRSN